jgi:hypothetical protein
MQKTNRFTLLRCGWLLLLLVLNACGLRLEAEDKSEPTPAAKEQSEENVPPKAMGDGVVTAVPFNPLSTPVPILTQAQFPELGLSLAHPPDWLAEQGPEFVLLLSSNDVFQQGTGALLEITPLLRSTFDMFDRADSTEDLMRMELERWIYLSPSNKIEIVQRAQTVQLGEIEAATAVINLKELTFPPGQEVIPSNEFEIQTAYHAPHQSGILQTVRVWIAIVPFDQQLVLFYGLTPLKIGESFQAEFEAIVQSVILTEPSTNSIEG